MLSSNTSSASGDATYIEDVFSMYLYTGNRPTGQTITNNIDLSTKGGMVWLKDRSAANSNWLVNSATGSTNGMYSNSTAAQAAYASGVTSLNTNGFTLGADSGGFINVSGNNYVSWTFRKQPKFFDVVTYTGNNTTQNIAHSLGSTPGCVIVKCTNAAAGWYVWHRGQSAGYYSILNTTAAQTNGSSVNTFGNNTTYVDPTSTQFTVGSNGNINQSGNTYVAYLFAHDAGGFGLTGTDNVISCGSFTTDGSGLATVNLGYEPQYLLLKDTTNAGSWFIRDTMRGLNQTGYAFLQAQSSAAESSGSGSYITPTATGFTTPTAGAFTGSATYIYIAIRRGPMKVPTDATKVFLPTASSDGTGTQITTGFPVSMQMSRDRSNNDYTDAIDRLRGVSTNNTEEAYTLETASTAAESYTSNLALSWGNTGFKVPNTYGFDPKNAIYWSFQRAPQFFDEVCYTGTGSATTVTHNLGAVPELMIVKSRSTAVNWPVYASATGNTQAIYLNTTGVPTTNSTFWNNTSPTSTQFTVGSSGAVNGTSVTYVAYLFATCAGVSKVGSYTGTGTLTTINCGFTGGARFVLIKRTDSTSDWYVWDTARGMTAGTDYSLSLNTVSAQVNANSVYTITTGFQLLASPSADVNTNGGSYIYLAIA